jgi:phosphatidylglycerophosphate synthase
VGVLGAVSAAQGGYWPLVIGAFLFQSQSVLDGCDGEMSRVSHRGSKLGEWLDTVGDDLTNYGFFGGAGLGLYRSTGNELYALAGAVCVTCGVIASGIEYRYLIKIGSGDLLKYPLSQATNNAKGLFGFVAQLTKRDTFVFLTLLAALGGALGPMLCIFSLGSIGVLFSVLKTELRLAREARAAQS